MTFTEGRLTTAAMLSLIWSVCVAMLSPSALRGIELIRSWTTEAAAPRGSLEYRDLCVAGGGATLVLAAVTDAGSGRELVTLEVDENGPGPLTAVAAAGALGRLADGYRCALFGEGETLIVGRAIDGTIVALSTTDRDGEPLVLGSGGYEVMVYDLIHLGARKFAIAGSKHVTGFLASFDLDTRQVLWRELGRERASLMSDLRSSDQGVTVCGMEGGQDGEVLSQHSQLVVATFDQSNASLGELRTPGRGCFLVDGGVGTTLLYEWGEPPPGPLRLLRLDGELSIRESTIVRDRISYFIALEGAQIGRMVAILNRPLGRERIDLFDADVGRFLGSTLLGLPVSAEMDLVSSDQELLVVTQPRKEASGESVVRIDAFRLP